MSHEPDGALSDAAARRMSNQIARVFRGTYGATTGMQTIATSVARQMLAAGLAPDAIARTLERCVLTHPDHPIAGAENASHMLVVLTGECVAEAAREATGPAPATGGRGRS